MFEAVYKCIARLEEQERIVDLQSHLSKAAASVRRSAVSRVLFGGQPEDEEETPELNTDCYVQAAVLAAEQEELLREATHRELEREGTALQYCFSCPQPGRKALVFSSGKPELQDEVERICRRLAEESGGYVGCGRLYRSEYQLNVSYQEALLAYVYFEQPPEMHNMNSVMELFVLMQHRYGPQGRSQLDDIFEDLAMEKPASFAARQYGLYHMAPDKTAQSIDVSLGMRMSAFNIPSIMKICEDDTIHLEELASDKKVALFVVTPDTTTAYNFLAAVMFQQCFQILVHTADNREDHCLPRHVRFLLDEFPNIGMIPDFQILISTIRSRNIGCTLIYQSIAQLKSQYGDDWGTILENCDSELVLGGGNNPESLEFFGKQLGKRTIEVLNTTENLGAQGSFSKNYQVASRDLMTPEEIRTMPRNRCLLMISGVVPFYSYKFDLKKHPNYALVEKEGHRPFDYERRAENNFAAFLKNVQEINNIELDDDESDT